MQDVACNGPDEGGIGGIRGKAPEHKKISSDDECMEMMDNFSAVTNCRPFSVIFPLKTGTLCCICVSERLSFATKEKVDT